MRSPETIAMTLHNNAGAEIVVIESEDIRENINFCYSLGIRHLTFVVSLMFRY